LTGPRLPADSRSDRSTPDRAADDLTDFLDAPDPAADARSGDPAQIGDIISICSTACSPPPIRTRAPISSPSRARRIRGLLRRSRRIPCLAKAAFEARDWPATVRLSRYRLTLYAAYLDHLAPLLRTGLPEAATDEGLWNAAEAHLLAAIAHRYEADFAFAFWHSLRRKLFENEWRPVAYASAGADAVRCIAEPVLVAFSATLPIAPEVVREIMDMRASPRHGRRRRRCRRAAEVIARGAPRGSIRATASRSASRWPIPASSATAARAWSAASACARAPPSAGARCR